jgi:flagellum-specific ATP synthase
MHAVANPDDVRRAKHFKTLVSRYQRNRDLINVGAYSAGSDAVLDQAIAMWPRLEAFLQQDMHQNTGFDDSVMQLARLIDGGA